MKAANKWPIGLNVELAVLDFTVESAAEKFCTEFEIDHDDLDYYYYSTLSLNVGTFALIRYRSAPYPGITLLGMDTVSPDEQIALFCDYYNIGSERLLWQEE